MTIQHDEQGFLTGRRLERDEIVDRLDELVAEMRALRRDLAGRPTSRAAGRAESSIQNSDRAEPVSLQRPIVVTPPRAAPDRDARGRFVTRETRIIERRARDPIQPTGRARAPESSPETRPERRRREPAQPPGRGSRRGNPPTPPGRERDAQGRFTREGETRAASAAGNPSGGLTDAIRDLGARVSGLAGATADGMERGDPLVQGFNELTQPLKPLARGFGKILSSAGERRDRRERIAWYRRFFALFRDQHREETLEERRQRRLLESLNRRGTPESGNGGFMALLALVPALLSALGGLGGTIAGVLASGARNLLGPALAGVLSALGLKKIAERLTGRPPAAGGAGQRGGGPGPVPDGPDRARGGRGGWRGMLRGSRGLPGIGALLGVGFMASDVYASETDETTTRAEKDVNTGRAVGAGLGAGGGALAGGLAGAAIGGPIGGIVGALAGAYFGGSAGEPIGETVGGWVGELRESDLVATLGEKWQYAADFTTALSERLGTDLSARWESVAVASETAWSNISERFAGVSEWARTQFSGIKTAFDGVAEWTKGAWENTKTATVEAASTANAWVAEQTGVDVGAGAKAAADATVKAAEDAGAAVKNAWESVTGWVGEIKSEADQKQRERVESHAAPDIEIDEAALKADLSAGGVLRETATASTAVGAQSDVTTLTQAMEASALAVQRAPSGAGPSGGAAQQAASNMASGLSSHLYSQTQAAIGKGVKYGFGSKQSKSGSIDCSGWVSEINNSYIDSIATEAENPQQVKQAKQLFTNGGGGAAHIVENLSKATGELLTNEQLTPESLKEGMIIGEDNGVTKWDAGRFKGIDHITQVVRDPKTGEMMVSQSSGKKGVNLTRAEDYLAQKNKRGTKLYGVDTNRAISQTMGLSGQGTAVAPSTPSAPTGAVGSPGAASGPSVAASPGGWVIGQTSKQYESGRGGAGTVSTGKGDRGGASYGTYQLASKTGTLQQFLKSSPYGQQFQGLTPGTSEFNAKWKEVAASDPNFGEAQHQFIKQTHYDPQIARLKKSGIDLSGRGAAVQDAVWSTSTQFGGGTSLIQKALNGRDPASMSDAEVVTAIQDYKIANNDQLFKSSSANIRAGTLKRAHAEKKSLQALASQSGSSAPSSGTPAITEGPSPASTAVAAATPTVPKVADSSAEPVGQSSVATTPTTGAVDPAPTSAAVTPAPTPDQPTAPVATPPLDPITGLFASMMSRIPGTSPDWRAAGGLLQPGMQIPAELQSALEGLNPALGAWRSVGASGLGAMGALTGAAQPLGAVASAMPRVLSAIQMPRLSEPSAAPPEVSAALAISGGGSQANLIAPEVGRDVSDRRIAHIVTGAYSSGGL